MLRWRHQAQGEPLHGRLGAVGDAQFADHPLDMGLGRAGGDAEFFADFAVGETARDQAEHLTLARRQRIADGRTALPAFDHAAQQLGADHAVERTLPGRDLARLVEVAAFQTKLKVSGYNPAKELNDIATRLNSAYGKGKGTLDGKPWRWDAPPQALSLHQHLRLEGQLDLPALAVLKSATVRLMQGGAERASYTQKL